jgi:hypothetical protein
MKSYELYEIISSQEIPSLLDCIYTFCSDNSDLGPMRKVFRRQNDLYFETLSKILLLNSEVYDLLKKEGLDKKNNYDFIITPYVIKKNDYPPKDGTYYFFIEPSKKNIVSLQKKLRYLSSFFNFSEKEWKIQKNGMVKFTDEIPHPFRILWKILLDDPEEYRVSWYNKKIT